jgi:hypothetical protein
MLSMPTTIYLSSTYKDLKENRAFLIEYLEKSGYGISCMEKYPDAYTQDIIEKIEEDVKACDLYLLIVGESYGSFARDSFGIVLPYSYTHAEYKTAVRNNKKRLIFIENYSTLPTDKNLLDFIAEIRQIPKPIGKFNDKTELLVKITSSLMAELNVGGNRVRETVKYLCDRSGHVDSFKKRVGNRPSACCFLLFGNTKNGHDLFVKRCKIILNGIYPNYASLDLSCFAFLQAPTNEKNILLDLKNKLVADLNEKLSNYDLQSDQFEPTTIFKLLEARSLTSLFIRIIVQTNYIRSQIHLYRRAIEQLCTEFADNENKYVGKSIVFFVHLQYNETVPDDLVHPAVAEFLGNGYFEKQYLPALTKVSEPDIMEWMIQNLPNLETEPNELLTEYFMDVPKDAEGYYFMNDALKGFEKIINMLNQRNLN